MIIGISGRAGSGKDTLGSLIVKEAGSMWEIKKFAGKLKQIASILTGIPVEKFEDQDFKETNLGEEWNQPMFGLGKPEVKKIPMKVRTFLQLLGTEAMRFGLHGDTWVNALFADYDGCPECGEKENLHDNHEYGMGHGDVIDILCNECGSFFKPANWIITDVRFKNEAKAIKDRGGVLIKVTRKKVPQLKHESEVALDSYEGFDYVFDNDGTIEELAVRAKGLLMMLSKRE